MTSLVGQRVGRYEVGQIVDSVSLCRTYLARDSVLGRAVMLKIQSEPDSRAPSRSLLANEASTLAQLSHPGILQVHDVGTHEGRAWVVFEHLEGGSLASALDAGTLSAEALLRSVVAAADAVGYAHRRGFVHRALSARQVWFDAEGRVRVVSFGLALHREGSPESIEMLKGWPRRSSCEAPELRSGALDLIGPPSDVWSLGMILREGFNCVRPALEPGADLVRICDRCLARDPADRYPDASVLADTLRVALGLGAGKASRVFVSHSTQDRELVEREIVGLLERNGVPTWYSKADIDSASEWERTIVKGLESCEWFLLAMSPRSAVSEWVRDELGWAFTKRPGRILPVLLEACDPFAFHIRLARIQHVDLTGDREEARRRILASLGPA